MHGTHKVLNLEIKDLIEDTDILPFEFTEFDPRLYLRDDAYTKLSQLGKLTSYMASVLTTPGLVHVDVDNVNFIPRVACLNILLDGQGSVQWINMPPESKTSAHVLGNTSVFHKVWDNVSEEYAAGHIYDEWKTGKIAVLRIGIPHRVVPPRRIISIRWSAIMTWEETLTWFDENFKFN